MKIALFGGTFNPIHSGHLEIAKYLLYKIKIVDRIIFLPAFIPPHKKVDFNISPLHRFSMVKIAIAEFKEMDISLWEINSGGVSYTINTLKKWLENEDEILEQKREGDRHYPESEKYLIIGADCAFHLPTWKRWIDIIQLVKIIVFPRLGYEKWLENLKNEKFWQKEFEYQFIKITTNFINISSKYIRSKFRVGESPDDLVAKKVIKYIKKNNIYK